MLDFLKFFLGKIEFLDKKNVYIFENSSHFLILCIVLQNETSLLSGGLRPRTRRVIAFKWPGRPPRKNPGDATGPGNQIDFDRRVGAIILFTF